MFQIHSSSHDSILLGCGATILGYKRKRGDSKEKGDSKKPRRESAPLTGSKKGVHLNEDDDDGDEDEDDGDEEEALSVRNLGRTRKAFLHRSFDALFPYDKYPDNNSITSVMGNQLAMNKLGPEVKRWNTSFNLHAWVEQRIRNTGGKSFSTFDD